MGTYSFVFLITSTFILSQVSSRAVNITSSWILPQEGFPHFFRYFKDLTTWDDAKVICGSFHGELLTVESDERRDAARAYLKELDVLENIWCGLQRSSIEAPFVWTGGGQGPVVGDAYWQEGHPLEPERLCAAINPLYDFRWQSFPCTGPQLNSFVCQLPVPEWAESCLVNSLPSLTVTYLPESSVIELLSDCGLAGTKRIACKGEEKEEALMKRLSCDGSDFISTQGWSSKSSRRWDTSTPSDIVTIQMTRSSGTRHKRESGATSTSTDMSLLVSESSQSDFVAEIIDQRIPTPERLSPLDTTTLTAEYAKEDQIEATTLSALKILGETSSPDSKVDLVTPTEKASNYQTPVQQAEAKIVKQWLTSQNNKLPTTVSVEASTLKKQDPQLTTQAYTKPNLINLKQAQNVMVRQWVAAQNDEILKQQKDTHTELPTTRKVDILETSTEKLATNPVTDTNANRVPSTETPQNKVEMVTPPVAPRVISTASPLTEMIESGLPHPPMIQHKENHKKATATTAKPMVTERAIVEVTPIDEKPQEVVMTTAENVEFNETDNNILPQEGESESRLPGQEALVSQKTKSKLNDLSLGNSQEKTTRVSPQVEIKTTAFPLTTNFERSTRTPHTEETSSSAQPNMEESPTTSQPTEELITVNENTGETVITGVESMVTEVSLAESTTQSTSTKRFSEEDYVPKNVPVIIIEELDEVEIAETRDKEVDDVTKADITTTHEKDNLTPKIELPIETTSLKVLFENESVRPTKTVLDAGRPKLETSSVEMEKLQTNRTGEQENKEYFTWPASTHEPKDTVTETTASRYLSSTVKPISGESAEGVTNSPSQVMREATSTAAADLQKAQPTPSEEVFPFSEESSEEAENPKRISRSRLFPHSNPLSFYPYFFNKMLG